MNRNFLVTGGAQGIGLAYCRTILAGGGNVFFTDINEVQGEKTQEKLVEEFGKAGVGFCKQDVTDEAGWPLVWDAADAFFSPGKVEALCNNAGIVHVSAWKRVLDINLCGLVTGTMLAIERLGASRGGPGGLIVQTASIASFFAPFPTIEEGMYMCSKQGVLGLVRSMGKDMSSYKKEKVRMVGICPTGVNTEMIKVWAEARSQEIEQSTQVSSSSATEPPNTGLLEPHEIGEAFQQIVVGGDSGQMLVVMPDFRFYWPDWNHSMIKIFSMICLFCIKVMRHRASEPILPGQMMNVGFAFLLLIGIGFHLFLSCLGF